MKRKKLIAFGLAALLATTVTACDAPTKTINGVTYSDYGLLNQSEAQNPKIQYEPDWSNIVVACILMETVFVPLYVFGYHFMDPVGVKTGIPGQIDGGQNVN